MATRLGFRQRPVDPNRELNIVLHEEGLETEESVRDPATQDRSEKVCKLGCSPHQACALTEQKHLSHEKHDKHVQYHCACM
jgi:hypothetical protein